MAFAGIAAGGRGGFRIEAPSSGEVDVSLYGGGRRGQKRDLDDYAEGGDSDDGRAAADAQSARDRVVQGSRGSSSSKIL